MKEVKDFDGLISKSNVPSSKEKVVFGRDLSLTRDTMAEKIQLQFSVEN